ncbi:hypothetical protein ACFQ6Q_00105 [Streptomyces sp. NPDC056437]|uniref:hypothetical protein n=1 Tax=Streptomyces sp. NPDC056437 TaxID=3345816 RepID=UPI0036B97487
MSRQRLENVLFAGLVVFVLGPVLAFWNVFVTPYRPSVLTTTAVFTALAFALSLISPQMARAINQRRNRRPNRHNRT